MPESYGKRNIPLMILQKIQLADILFMSFSYVQLEAKKDRKKKMKKMREERREKIKSGVTFSFRAVYSTPSGEEKTFELNIL